MRHLAEAIAFFSWFLQARALFRLVSRESAFALRKVSQVGPGVGVAVCTGLGIGAGRTHLNLMLTEYGILEKNY
ncbi:MAG: hypothetical protein EAZ60_21320 [Oscillatoriales cyanobacterium]|nr:MAG: hypothetical protein EAZ60_21320 [Oscillatoriales cyanobacterium]